MLIVNRGALVLLIKIISSNWSGCVSWEHEARSGISSPCCRRPHWIAGALGCFLLASWPRREAAENQSVATAAHKTRDGGSRGSGHGQTWAKQRLGWMPWPRADQTTKASSAPTTDVRRPKWHGNEGQGRALNKATRGCGDTEGGVTGWKCSTGMEEIKATGKRRRTDECTRVLKQLKKGCGWRS
jgi:hypothetical protein